MIPDYIEKILAKLQLPAKGIALYRVLDQLEYALINKALKQHRWNISKTAMALRMPRGTLATILTKKDFRRPTEKEHADFPKRQNKRNAFSSVRSAKSPRKTKHGRPKKLENDAV